ncbi:MULTISPECIES: GPP34 family phosphoprotein [unclassified Streptomyces]|uniref:GOLPH3/VPS74 family protein n=1 Tax=unclassified Streptomyces TaxID=2593676 RepID=UPI0035DC6228
MTSPAPELTLPEELLLLALDPLRGKSLCRDRFLEYGVAGAALRELEFQGRIAERSGWIRVVDPLAPPDPFLAQVLGSLSAPEAGRPGDGGIDARRWVRQAGRYAGELCTEHLVRRSVLRRETHRLLGLLPYQRHPATDPARSLAIRDRFAATCAARFPDQRGRALAALVSAVDLAAEAGWGGLRDRWAMRDLAHDDWAAHAVHENVRRDRSSGNRGPLFSSNSSSGDD